MRFFVNFRYVVAGLFSILITTGAGAGDRAQMTSPPVGPFKILTPANRTPKAEPLFPKLDSGLNRVVGSDEPITEAEDLGYRTRDQRIQVVAVTEDQFVPDLEQWLEKRGATFVTSASNLVQAFVAPGLLPMLNDHPWVKAVRKPGYIDVGPQLENDLPAKIQTYTSEGVQAMNADSWHDAGFSGQGLKIGIIDGGYSGIDPLVGTELPDSDHLFGLSFGGTDFYGTKHGTACAEIVYDVAPGITEMYVAATATVVDMVNAGIWLDSMGVDMMTMSMGFGLGFGVGDGSGPLADLIDSYVASGGLIVVAAGNSADNHWQGGWNDGGGNYWLDFVPDGEINGLMESDGVTPHWFGPLATIEVTLVWNQWTAPSTDLELCLYELDLSGNAQIVECSENQQSGLGSQSPVERVNYMTLLGGYYGLAVFHFSGDPNVDMEMESNVGTFFYSVPEGSIAVPADTGSAFSVGALDAGPPYSLENYSSRGPTNGPGGSLTGGSIKPDIAGYANVSTASYGDRVFNGTSAACPHVAGAAALVWSAHPNWSNNQVRSYLETTAVEMGPSGKDNSYGHGRLYLGNPPQNCTYSISPTSQNFGSSGGSGTINVNTQSGCSWNASESLSWVSITSGSSGSGSGTVRFNVSSNSSASSRSGTIQAAGKTFSISQDGAPSCTYSISPTSQNFGSSGGSGTINVSTQSGCSWTASESLSWVSITSGSSGSGSGTVGFNVANNSSTNSRSGNIQVAGRTFSVSQSGASGGGSESYMVAGMAHANGAGGSVWRSTLAVTNRSGGTANLTLVYRYSGNSRTRSHTLQNGDIVEWVDVATSLFDVGGTSAGSIEVQSNRPVIVTARTYNEGADGTFGQFLPGADDGNKLAYGERGILAQVKKTSAFRTNIGFVNLGSASVTVRTKLYSNTGAQLGNTVTTPISAKQWKQENDVFQKAGVSYCEVGYAIVEVTTNGGSVWAYASVVDEGTGDPTTIPVSVE